mmetsp:Transcript_39124/g.94636  ORF Transcript_39124/g.94636 Transcript_39124/m.94636 type:complete len:268 (-) Transcript_39124:223-1026(-)
MMMKVPNLVAVVVLLSGISSIDLTIPGCNAFTIPHHPAHSSPAVGSAAAASGTSTTTRLWMSTATPDDAAIQEAYSRWRQKYSKGEFSPERYQNFKSNFLAVTARNNMERQRAAQTGGAAPTPIKLNQYGDYSAEEYSRMMQQNQGAGTNNSNQNNFNRNNMQNSNGVRPATPGVSSTTNNMPGMGSLPRRQQEMANNASSNLRAAMNQRSGLEGDIGQLQATLAEKQRLLQEAINEEQFCADRIALREEQKRILNDRLRNGWDDEK